MWVWPRWRRACERRRSGMGTRFVGGLSEIWRVVRSPAGRPGALSSAAPGGGGDVVEGMQAEAAAEASRGGGGGVGGRRWRRIRDRGGAVTATAAIPRACICGGDGALPARRRAVLRVARVHARLGGGTRTNITVSHAVVGSGPSLPRCIPSSVCSRAVETDGSAQDTQPVGNQGLHSARIRTKGRSRVVRVLVLGLQHLGQKVKESKKLVRG